MAAGDQYRIKAAESHARARGETSLLLRAEYENLARAYLRLAEQAERNALFDVTYEPPPPKIDDPEMKP
jgi:hypothetical protein